MDDVGDSGGEFGGVDFGRREGDGEGAGGDGGVDEVAGDFEVTGALIFEDGGDDAIDFGGGGEGVIEDGVGDGEVAVDFGLGVEVFDAVMEEGVGGLFGDAWGAGDDEEGDLFGVGVGGGVGEFEAADAVGAADDAEAAESGVGIGGEAGALFVAGDEHGEAGFFEGAEEAEGVIADDAEAVLDAVFAEASDEVGGDGGLDGELVGGWHRGMLMDCGREINAGGSSGEERGRSRRGAGGAGGWRLGAGEDEEVVEAELKFFVADEAEVGCGKNLYGLGDIVAVMFF